MKFPSVKNIFLVVGLLSISVFLLGACASNSSVTTETTEENTELGTIIGNPTTATSSLTIKAANNSDTESDDDCWPFGIDVNDPTLMHTQKCKETPQDYTAIISGIYLLECVDASDTPTTCTRDQSFGISKRVSVYTDGIQATTIDDIGTALNLDLLNLTETMNVGGIQIITQSLGQKFPENDESGVDRIATMLQGKNYLICMTPSVGETIENMIEKCGLAYTRRGDVLVDIDGDGNYGFIDTATLTVDSISETQTKPEDYSDFSIPQVASGVFSFSGNNNAEYTDGENFGDTLGVFAPILGFPVLTTIEPNTNYTFTATVNVNESYTFVDGDRAGNPEDLCIGALSPTPCEVDDDPLSVGVYNPYYDGPLLMAAPTTDVTVEAISN